MRSIPDTLIPAETCCGLLLAAGSGSRFQQSITGLGNASLQRGKLLAPLPNSGITVARTSAMQLKRVLARVIAIVPESNTALTHELTQAGCEIIEHHNAQCGIGSTLAAGIRTLQASSPQPTTCLVALADMPWIRPETISAICQLQVDTLVAAPEYKGRRGHPVRFDASIFPELAMFKGDEGAKSILNRHEIYLMVSDDSGVLHDIDTVAQLYETPD